ncbi:MAG: 7-cyano-7-deazaguanine synthase, partial [Planctomycetota bacterium]|nr:7-cyano-7-deazaguanine synthase [Planctomycetota bacterium]
MTDQGDTTKGPRAVVLLSGGLDSSTVLAWARSRGRECFALSFDYGQRHRIELERATEIAGILGAAEHRIVSVDLRAFGGSALTDDIDVPKGRIDAHGGSEGGAPEDDIPITYVPARNTIFLSFALAYAEVRSVTEIWLGINAIDYSGYP